MRRRWPSAARSCLPTTPTSRSSLNNLGYVQWELRDYAGAKQRHEEALAIRRKALPADHPDIAWSLNNLGMVQFGLRDYAGAKRSYEEALAIRRKVLPADHPDIADSLQQPGQRAARVCGTTRERSRAMRRRWPSAARSLPPGPPRHRLEPQQPGAGAVWFGGLRGCGAQPRGVHGDDQQ